MDIEHIPLCKYASKREGQMKSAKCLVLFVFLTSFEAIAMNQETCCPVVELRQYTLKPGQRDVLIELFDREFVESQEALGMHVIGQFRDLDNPNRFVWLRGFPDMAIRKEALTAFYSGPVWKANRNAANATMVDTDNVLLLRPALPSSGFSIDKFTRAPVGTTQAPKGLLVATIYYLNDPADADFVNSFERDAKPVLTEAGASILACFVTESSPNNFPALPVREGEHVFILFSIFQDEEAYARYTAALSQSQAWNDKISKAMEQSFRKSPEALRLSPTARSLLK
jgi:quinol monooxygenase YgiN